MSMTQAQLLAALRDQMDATSSTRWSDATLLSWLGLASWQEWANILNVNNVYYSQSITTTQGATGLIALSALSNGTGDSAKNFYRILSLAQPSGADQQMFYQEIKYAQAPNPLATQGTTGYWYRLGTNIQCLPVAAGLSMSVQVNFRPPRVDQLSASSIAVDFPDGYEMLLVHVASAFALQKGGAETQAAAILRKTADDIRSMMLMDIGRQGTRPIVMSSFDSPGDWGG